MQSTYDRVLTGESESMSSFALFLFLQLFCKFAMILIIKSQEKFFNASVTMTVIKGSTLMWPLPAAPVSSSGIQMNLVLW